MKKVFDQEGTFAAMYAAERWCYENGISVGSCQAGSPRGLMRGDFIIAKWRNLTHKERRALDGTMEGNMREGPIVIELNDAGESP